MPRIPRFRSLPLRSRLAILTAAAVAVAVAGCALACWFIVRAQLDQRLDDALHDASTGGGHAATEVLLRRGCLSEPDSDTSDWRVVSNPYRASMQLITVNGGSCWVLGDQTLPVTKADLAVLRRESSQSVQTVTAADGTEMRVLTQQATITSRDQKVPVAISTALPLSEVTGPLNTLALVLLAVSGIGVLGASAAGLGVARAGLKPVDRLTDTVEHVARTEDLSVRIPVEGRDEIARLSASFNAMTAALSSSRDLQQQLIADAGHELRTPLTSLRTNIELLERSEMTGRALPPEDRRELMLSVKAQMGELAALIGDLQELSRPDVAHGGVPSQTVAFHEVVEAALERARRRTGPDLKITADVAPWYLRAEPSALERAVINLLDNAVKFSPPAGAIEVDLHGGELTVRDHGPGIPPEDLPHVFERFWRSASARSLPGSGLGLSIVARTVQQLGGTVDLHPAQEGGTVAVMRLPGAATPPPETS
ncbi:HAMP domain-containing sensor histidine kinase [Streptomyces sp. NPDC026673]|uniref:sensor histidine kinase n=1 Tax=Streptomyces sp. NPDC026673 TaxID=3155724 RepID=UPI0033C3DC66